MPAAGSVFARLAGASMGPAPSQAAEESLAAEELLTHVACRRTPIPCRCTVRSGLRARDRSFSPSTQAGVVAKTAEALEPIAIELKRQVLKAD